MIKHNLPIGTYQYNGYEYIVDSLGTIEKIGSYSRVIIALFGEIPKTTEGIITAIEINGIARTYGLDTEQ
jgi:hypothetical protein